MKSVERTANKQRIDELVRQCDTLFETNQRLIGFIAKIANDRDDCVSPGLQAEAGEILMAMPRKAKR